MITPKFQTTGDSFFKELRKRTNAYFTEQQAKQTGNFKLYSKAIILLISFIATYTHLVFFTSDYAVISIAECIVLGLLTSAIGFNIMHDGAHGSFSEQKFMNTLAGLSLNFLGANVHFWKTKHNIIHHSYTNIEGVDDDINTKPILRLCETQKRYKIHRFQHIYFLAAYSLFYLFWVFFADYKKYFTQKIGDMPMPTMKFNNHLSFWAFKIIHVILFIVTPIYIVGFTPWIVGFLSYTLFTGILISIVFQLAHTGEDTHFPVVNNVNGKVENEWALHQLRTTANFATKSKIVSWFTGGLNFQIEHHLFPKISHVHYPEISKIVKQLCKEYNINYIEYPNVWKAVASHVAHLRRMGQKEVAFA